MNKKIHLFFVLFVLASSVTVQAGIKEELQAHPVFLKYNNQENTGSEPESVNSSALSASPAQDQDVYNNDLLPVLPVDFLQPEQEESPQAGNQQSQAQKQTYMDQILKDPKTQAIGGYAIDHVTNALLGKEKKEEQQMEQVGDDAVGLLDVQSKEDWKSFIDEELEKHPQALAGSLIDFYKFNPKDVHEFINYINNKRVDTRQVTSLMRQVADSPSWDEVQNEQQYLAGQTVENSIWKDQFENTFKPYMKEVVKEEAVRYLKDAKSKLDAKTKNYFDTARQEVFGSSTQPKEKYDKKNDALGSMPDK
ncbi:MAG: hypothetical protein ACJAZS_000314 [Alteromonas naphthalenivorans]|jgi:hypothetical protein